MNQEIKTKWINALLSGQYKQGDHTLRKYDNTYCPLGVLCDVVDPTRWESQCGKTYFGFNYHGDIRTGFLPVSLSQALQITPSEEDKIVMMNDGGRSFKEIAEWIKRYL